jgi:hypothetical protein
MVLTQNEAKIAFTHILQVVFGRAAGTPLQLALEEEGIDDIFELINLDAPIATTTMLLPVLERVIRSC